MEKKINILYVTSALSDEGGWGRYSNSLTESVSKYAGVCVLTSKQSHNQSLLPTVFACLPEPHFDLWSQARAFLKIYKYAKGADIVHTLVEPYAPASALAAFFRGAKFVMTLHGTYSVPPKSSFSLRRYMMIFTLKRMAISTTGSTYTEQKAREEVSFGECRFIPNGVDTKTFHIIPNTLRDDVILTVGALKRRKGADTVAEAVGLLKDTYPKLKFKMVGDDSSTNFVTKITDIGKKYNISDRFEILGRISDSELVTLYNTCKIFVLAARDVEGNFEGFPMVFYEANACGAPVISTKGFGSEYAIKDGVNGFVIEPDNPQQLALTIQKIFTDTELQKTLTDGALREAANHTWDKVAPELMKLYRDAL